MLKKFRGLNVNRHKRSLWRLLGPAAHPPVHPPQGDQRPSHVRSNDPGFVVAADVKCIAAAS